MNKKVILVAAVMFIVAVLTLLAPGAKAEAAKRGGLVGGQFGSEDFTDLEDLSRLDSLQRQFSEDDGYGRQWSGKWQGFIIAPADGEITFHAETDRILQIQIAGKNIVRVTQGKATGSVSMIKAKEYPIDASYIQKGQSYDSHLKVQWSWAGKDPVSIGAANLFHTDKQEQEWVQRVQEADEDADDDDDNGDGDIADGADRIGQSLGASKASDAAGAKMPGLVGLMCEKKDFREPASRDVIKHVNHNWTGGPGDWSGYWQGYIEAPFTGEVTFTAKVDNGIRLAIGDRIVIDGLGRGKTRIGKASMVKGKKYAIRLWYFQDGDPSYLHLYWSWPGQDKIIVDESAFSYGPEDVKYAISKLSGDYWGFDEAPLHFDGKGSESLDLAYQHGRLVPAVGAQNYQVFRSNREHPEFTGGLKNTYIHAPMLAYWNGKFYLEFLSAPRDEHQDPTVTLLTASEDGRNWNTPKVIFPAFRPKGDSHQTISHQRMGFYVSPNARLLVLSFYGRWPSPNEGDGIGRAVREIYKDGSLGPIYFIRYNRHAGWNETNTPYPFYRTSPDKGFIEVCETLMANKPMVQQWWEEDRSEDGFYMVSGEGFKCKAFNWYTRNDKTLVGLWKAGYTAFSEDQGKTWSQIKQLPSVIVGHAKMWGQQTDDGRYAFVYNPHFEWRYPLVVTASDDGRVFRNMACVHGELPPRRYEGGAKDVGPQYVRGITLGNGNPPGDDMWLTYSMNKEDIWVSRVPVPIRHTVEKWVEDNFDRDSPGGVVTDWNIYNLKWARVEVAQFPSAVDKSLKLGDSEPYDYARAIRVFPNSKTATIKFELLAGQTNNGRCEIEVLSKDGARPVRIMLTETAELCAVSGGKMVDLMQYRADSWISFKIEINASTRTFGLAVDGKELLKGAGFAEGTDSVQRLSFRTGEYRRLGIGRKRDTDDLPGAGDPVKEAVYYVNNVSIRPR